MSILLRRFHNNTTIEYIIEYTAPERIVVDSSDMSSDNYLYSDSKSTYDYDTQTGKLVYNGKIRSLVGFKYTKLTSITVPESVEYVHPACFHDCHLLKTITFLHENYDGNASFYLNIEFFAFSRSNITDIYINVNSQDWKDRISADFLRGVPKYMLDDNGNLTSELRKVIVHCYDTDIEYECIYFDETSYKNGYYDHDSSKWQIKNN